MTQANLSWITPTLATGGDLSFNWKIAAAQTREILGYDFDQIIDVRMEFNDMRHWGRLGVPYLWLPADDRDGYHIPFVLFDAAVEAARGKNKVFVYCHMGINRGPSVAYAILLDQGVDAIKAFDMIRRARSVAAVYYAQDALAAHHARAKAAHPGSFRVRAAQQEAKDLKAHMASIWTKVERKRIDHIIRGLHGEDQVAYDANG